MMPSLWSVLKVWISRYGRLVFAILSLFLLTAATAPWLSPEHAELERLATLRHDPAFVLHAVAARMGIELSPDIPIPALLLESTTPPERWRAAAEGHWGMSTAAFTSFYTPDRNEIYLIDQAALHERRGGSLDDALAHELVHFLQAQYRQDALHTDWAEMEAVQIQQWFRAEIVQADSRTLRASLAPLAIAP